MRKRLWVTSACLLLMIVMVGCSTAKRVNQEQETQIEETDEKLNVEEEEPEQSEENESEEEEKEEKKETSIEYPLNLWFSSGVGAWGTSIVIYEDGSFVGNYHDSEMGDIGEGYPNGSCYICDFSGKFTKIVKVSDYAYSMTLATLSVEREIGDEYIEDQIRYICTGAAGLTGTDGKTPAKKFMLYTPGAPISSLSEDFLSWWGESYSNPNATVLPVYGLRNMETEDGFFN